MSAGWCFTRDWAAFASLVAAGVGAGASTASAQPATPPAVPVVLAPREQALLARGEISSERHVLGVVVAVVPGFGLGHLIEHRWKERGWIFTLGELAAFGLMTVAASESDIDQDLISAFAIVGWGSYLGLRVWEVADAVTGPKRHNRRLREIRLRAGTADAGPAIHLYMAPSRQAGVGTVAGIALRF